ncbi:MAG TPA: GNAT family N-acetyltransferase [Bacillales bacterium]|nr:GNAT family N-acetyltransferase [Bacillales bacterium]
MQVLENRFILGEEAGLIHLREAVPSDLSEILAIYNDVVRSSATTFDLDEQTVEGRKQWFSGFDAKHPFIVAVEDERLIGYSYLSVFRGKPGYFRTVESSIYVHNMFRRQGVANMLMEELIRRATQLGHHVIVAGIANDAEPSVRLHRKFGFKKVGCFREVGRKFDEWQDVCFYQLILDRAS